MPKMRAILERLKALQAIEPDCAFCPRGAGEYASVRALVKRGMLVSVGECGSENDYTDEWREGFDFTPYARAVNAMESFAPEPEAFVAAQMLSDDTGPVSWDILPGSVLHLPGTDFEKSPENPGGTA